MYESRLAIAKDRELIQGVRVTSVELAHCRFLVGRAAEGMKRMPDDRTPGALGSWASAADLRRPAGSRRGRPAVRRHRERRAFAATGARPRGGAGHAAPRRPL